MRGGKDRGKARLQRCGDIGGVIHRKSGLGDEGQFRRIAHLKAGHIADGFDQQNLAFRQLAHGAHGFGVAGMADHDHLQAVFVVARGFVMHLCHQRAGCVEIFQSPFFGFMRYRLGHAMSGKNDMSAIGHFIQFLDENSTLGFQAVDNKAVVDDFMAHINGRTILFQGKLDDLYGAVYTGAKAARCGKQKPHWPFFGRFGKMLFSHRQCPLGNVAANAKSFRLLHRNNLADKEL